MFQLDVQNFAGTHMAIHIAPVGDLDLYLLGFGRYLVPQAVQGLCYQFQHNVFDGGFKNS